MSFLLATMTLMLGSGSPAPLPVSPASSTAAVSTLELIDPATWAGHTVSGANGVYFRLCGPDLRPCSLQRGALRARTQGLALAVRTFRETDANLVIVALPQSATNHALLVFERDVLEATGDADTLTGDRLYAMGGLFTIGVEDSLFLVRLPVSTLGR
ncbi:MAG: hypothetical protein M3R12_03890 [Actinomycetota bacterium]|nr:hypothetical protein [Actinomycetota bacterium]